MKMNVNVGKRFFFELMLAILHALERRRDNEQTWQEKTISAYQEVFSKLRIAGEFVWLEDPPLVTEEMQRELENELSMFFEGLCFGSWMAFEHGYKFSRSGFVIPDRPKDEALN